jgi:hypothetical protein
MGSTGGRSSMSPSSEGAAGIMSNHRGFGKGQGNGYEFKNSEGSLSQNRY